MASNNEHFNTMKNLLPKNLIAFMSRLLPLGKAVWRSIDIALDMRQAVKYHEYAYDANGTYQQWAENNTDPVTNRTETVSTSYFKTSIVIFFLPPLILALFLVGVVSCLGLDHDDDDQDGLGYSITKRLLKKCNIDIESIYEENCFVIICYPIIFIFDYLIWCLFCYILFPLAALVIGVKVLFGAEIDPDEDIFYFGPISIPKEELPCYLLIQYLGEALPQLILSLIFLSRNYPFLLVFDTIFGIPIPICLVSAIFSFGSLCMGFYSCLCECRQ